MSHGNADMLGLADIADRCRAVASSLPIKALYLFGSYADGTARVDSDVDLACEFQEGYRPGISFLSLDELFQDALGKDVDLLTVDGIQGSPSDYLRESFRSNAIEVYARG